MSRVFAVILGVILLLGVITVVVGAALAPIVMGMEMLTRENEGDGQ
jgi:hypothetical protein